MQFNKLQYITDSPVLAQKACEAGVRWVQARVKNKSINDTRIILQQIIAVCASYDAVCIVNDHLHLALQEGADGVHLGKEDISIVEAKKIIGRNEFIVGGTANTFDDVKKLSELNVDYIGLGPFRFTTTKEKLSPILGEEGYSKIIAQLKEEKISFPPVYAIGGIVAADVNAITATGIYGVAVSGVISHADDKRKTVEEFYNSLNESFHGNN
jgi:thiamine-phosphate pyrophosphorylase